MNQKKDLREMTMTREELAERLRGETDLSGEEERVLRMRHGCTLDPRAPLAQLGAGDADLGAELLLMEHDVVKAAQQALGQGSGAAHPQDSREKAAIVHALRTKG